ncbi:MAG: hypothetical protein WBM50_18240, partial [Acidimicrobiales bacterium]
IGSEQSGHRCDWGQFAQLADVEYDSGYGSAQVATDLVIVFFDGTKLRRGEYDGSEWWEFIAPFTEPAESLPIDRLVGAYDATLAVLADPEQHFYRDGIR